MASPISRSPVTASATSTPPTSASPSPEQPPPYQNPLEDIFSTSPGSEHNASFVATIPRPAEEPLSDLPALRRQHVTAGYREGLSVAKAKTIQAGFDAGYPEGIELGMRVGRVVGSLEAIIMAMERQDLDAERLKLLLGKARRELAMSVFLEGVSDEDLAEGTTSEIGGNGEQAAGSSQARVVFSSSAIEALREWEMALDSLLRVQPQG